MEKFETTNSSSPPRYQQVYQALLERIRNGEFANGKPLPPERQLAETYKVSRITVIKALDELERENIIKREQGRGTFVIETREQSSSPETPGETKAKSTKTIAFVCSFLANPYLFNILMGIAQAAAKHRYNLQVISSSDTTTEEAENIKEAIARSVDGIIVYPDPGYKNIELYSQLKAQGFPMVMVDRYYPEVITDRVVFDDETAGYELTKLLISKGHSRIAVLTHYEVEATSVRDRLGGYRRALEDAGLVYDDDFIWLDVYSSFYPDAGEEHNDPAARRRLHKRLERFKPTALLAVNQDVAERVAYDLMALNAERVRQSAKATGNHAYKVHDLEIATISYRRAANYSPYQFTSAIQSGEVLGVEAAELLINRLKQITNAEPQFIKVPMQLVSSVGNGQANTPVLI
jgi:DNA-binding LacI/PurR family transcriptional regulator